MPQYDMTAGLVVQIVSMSLETLDQFCAAPDWEAAHVTSTTSSESPGGTGSPRVRRLER